jgi:tetratricopeptide (TPR) repeat protein
MQASTPRKRKRSLRPVTIVSIAKDEALRAALAAAIEAAGHEARALDSDAAAPGKKATSYISILIVSPAALRSQQFLDIAQRAWHYQAVIHPPALLLLMLAAPLDGLDCPAFLHELPCIVLPAGRPYPPEEAVQCALQALDIVPGEQQPDALSPELLLLRGKSFWLQGRQEEAISCFERVVQRKPESSNAWFNLGSSLGYTPGRKAEAVVAFQRGLALEPGSDWAWSWLADLLEGLERYEEALIVLNQRFAGEPGKPYALYKEAQLLGKLTRYEEALSACEQSLAAYAADENFEPEAAEDAWYQKCWLLLQLERYEEALAILDQYLIVAPENADGWRGKALALRQLGRFDEALSAADRALAIYGAEYVDVAETWYVRGLALSDAHHVEEALLAFDHALALFAPQASEARRVWESKARMLRALGCEEEAQRAEEHTVEEHIQEDS